MDYKIKECWCCEKYDTYYSKRLCHFENANCGFCRTHKEIITDKHHACDKWCFNGTRRKLRKEVSLKALNEALDNLVEIKQILVDEINDNKIYPID